MEKERRVKVLSLAALIIAVLGLTVAFAALSQTLTINGSASVDAAEWNIHFVENSIQTVTEDMFSGKQTSGIVDVSNIQFTGTTISGLSFTVTKPDDTAIVAAQIINDGTINAKLSSVNTPTLCTLDSSVESCDWNNDGSVTQEDIDKVNNNLTLLVSDGSLKLPLNNSSLDNLLVKTDPSYSEDNYMTIGIVYGKLKIENGEVVSVESSSELPKRDLVFNDLSVALNYVQAD